MGKFKHITGLLHNNTIVSKANNIEIIDKSKTAVVLNGGEITLVDSKLDFQYLITNELKKAILTSLIEKSKYSFLNSVDDFYDLTIHELKTKGHITDEEMKEYESNVDGVSKQYAEKKLVETIIDMIELVNYLDYSEEEINQLLKNHILK